MKLSSGLVSGGDMRLRIDGNWVMLMEEVTVGDRESCILTLRRRSRWMEVVAG